MTLERAVLAHVLPAQAVYFVLRRPLGKDTFMSALHALEARAHTGDTRATPDEHWRALEERMAGKSRWDMVMPPYVGPPDTVEAGKMRRTSSHVIPNILRVRPFVAYTTAGLQYSLDIFNPCNELEMPYAGAGEPVVALLIRGLEPEPGPIAHRLAENGPFYEILKNLDGILQPEHVCGAHSMMSVLCAYLEGRADSSRRPWEFLYPLHVLKGAPIALTPETRISGRLVGMLPGKEVKLARAEDWGNGRVLIQIRPGLDAHIAWEYAAVAKALGMTCVQQLVEGRAD